MNSNESKRNEGQRLTDLRTGSRSSRHVPTPRKGTRSSRKAAALREWR